MSAVGPGPPSTVATIQRSTGVISQRTLAEQYAKRREYQREYQRQYQRRPEVQAKRREYRRRPEVQAKKREYQREYQRVRYAAMRAAWLAQCAGR